MSTDETMLRIPFDEVVGLAEEIFIGGGVGLEEAHLLSESLVRADARGIMSHGVVRVPSYVDQFENGRFSKKTKVDVVHETHFSTLLDANNGLGSVASYKSVELTKNKARSNGIAFTVVRNSNHYGAAGLWSSLIAEDKDLIGFTSTTSILIVSAPTGLGRAIGSNPISIAVPAELHPNLCLDISMGNMAQGKIWEYKRLNKPFPDNFWLGPDGEVTVDPNKFKLEEYVMIPFGLHKGFGLGVVLEMLTSGLSGGAFHQEYVGFTKEQLPLCHSFAAMRIDAFIDSTSYRKNVDAYIDYLHGLPSRANSAPIMFPGEIEAKFELDAKLNGVKIPAQVLKDMKACAVKYGVDTAPYAQYLG
ncbi:MAG: Ldh family oxidoreductase [Deltaproteobacteria bacterium]|jgi:LDH2 family malate/lactate/ureidoglycolate dehydrogenase|nr:Ldh family oxidoreductase [Deltaproteobacteria bacterium]